MFWIYCLFSNSVELKWLKYSFLCLFRCFTTTLPTDLKYLKWLGKAPLGKSWNVWTTRITSSSPLRWYATRKGWCCVSIPSFAVFHQLSLGTGYVFPKKQSFQCTVLHNVTTEPHQEHSHTVSHCHNPDPFTCKGAAKKWRLSFSMK